MRLARLAAATVALLLSASAHAASPEPSAYPEPSASAAAAPALRTAACTMGRRKLRAVCGSLRVYEDRVARSGRTIDIAFVVLEAKHPAHRAIFFNPGGPGASSTQFAPFAADGQAEPYIARLLDRYDAVFVDDRGTGMSHPLACDLWEPQHRAEYFRRLWPDAPLRACRAKLAAGANLSLYATDYAVDDIDDVRAALGYPRVVLSGGSGGTQLFLDYARRHPAHVESLLLQGVAPPHFLIIPLEDARGAQLAVDHLVAACRGDAVCSARFPAFGAHFAALAHRFDRGPVPVHFRDPRSHAVRTLLLSKEVFADRLRQTLYGADSAAVVPLVVEQAYRGDTEPLAQLVDVVTRDFANLVPAGANLSITCAEDVPFITERDVVRTSAGSFQGDTRVRAQQRACRIWNVRPVSRAFQEPVRSSAPALLISGADDPTTPPEYARAELPYLPNARWMLVRNASHDTELPCVMALAERFVRAGSAAGLPLGACGGANRRPPFVTSLPKLLGG
jgi:pimeloyl-ACP methyl ester carboxylesterase